jgi:hypothetical protein
VAFDADHGALAGVLPIPLGRSEETPTTCEAAWRLARFTDEVQLRRQSLLIALPPKLLPPPKKHIIPKRSRQPLAHIPTSERGEVLLMKKMGILPPAAPVSSAAHNTYDTIFARNLSSEQV